MNYKPLTSVKYIVIHCSATPPNMDIGAKEIDRWHRERGFFSIGYHYVIRRNGVVEKGRDENTPGAHVRGHNHESIGICMVGGVKGIDKNHDGKVEQSELVMENNFTQEQWNALHAKLIELRAKYPQAEILGHRDLERRDNVATKDCPSFDVASWLKSRPL